MKMFFLKFQKLQNYCQNIEVVETKIIHKCIYFTRVLFLKTFCHELSNVRKMSSRFHLLKEQIVLQKCMVTLDKILNIIIIYWLILLGRRKNYTSMEFTLFYLTLMLHKNKQLESQSCILITPFCITVSFLNMSIVINVQTR